MDLNNANQRRMKQKYLREQLSINQWNPGDFSKFLLQQRDNGTDIDVWEFEELISEIEHYKRINKDTNYDHFKEVRNIQKKIEVVEEMDQVQEKLNTILGDNNPVEDFLSNIEEKLRREPKERFDKKIVVMGRYPKKKTKYVFKLIPDNREFTRKLNDAYWLQTNLMAEFPFYYVN